MDQIIGYPAILPKARIFCLNTAVIVLWGLQIHKRNVICKTKLKVRLVFPKSYVNYSPPCPILKLKIGMRYVACCTLWLFWCSPVSLDLWLTGRRTGPAGFMLKAGLELTFFQFLRCCLNCCVVGLSLSLFLWSS